MYSRQTLGFKISASRASSKLYGVLFGVAFLFCLFPQGAHAGWYECNDYALYHNPSPYPDYFQGRLLYDWGSCNTSSCGDWYISQYSGDFCTVNQWRQCFGTQSLVISTCDVGTGVWYFCYNYPDQSCYTVEQRTASNPYKASNTGDACGFSPICHIQGGNVQCNGSCNGQASDPSYIYQACPSNAVNSCGQHGYDRTYECDGSCRSSPLTDDQCPHPIIASAGTTCSTGTCSPTIGNGSNNALINAGNSYTFTWSVANLGQANVTSSSVSCSITDGTTTWNNLPLNGSWKTPTLYNTTRYTLTCKNGTVVTTKQTLVVRINPQFREI